MFVSGSLNSGGGLALTPHYGAPERLLEDDLSFDGLLASDVYTYGSPKVVVVFVV